MANERAGSRTIWVGTRNLTAVLAIGLLASACTNGGLDFSSESALGIEGIAPAADVGAKPKREERTKVARSRPKSTATDDEIAQLLAAKNSRRDREARRRGDLAPPAAIALTSTAETKERPNVLDLFRQDGEEPRTTGSIERPRATARRDRDREVRVASRGDDEVGNLIRSQTRETRGERKAKRKGSMTVIKPRKSGSETLAGVRDRDTLFGFKRKDREEGVQVASAAGLARGSRSFLKQHNGVNTSCFKPSLVSALKKVERHFGKRVVVTSGYRSKTHNARVGGVKNSKHLTCEAADFQVEGVSRSKIAAFLRSLPNRGGVGTYCHTKSVHYDVGARRDWSWGCRKRRA